MSDIKVPLDRETHNRLIAMAVASRRPLHWHASVLLRQAVGLPFPDADPLDEEIEQTVKNSKGGTNNAA
jgi:hypothetical protein